MKENKCEKALSTFSNIQESLFRIHHKYITVYKDREGIDKQNREHDINTLQEAIDKAIKFDEKETPMEVIKKELDYGDGNICDTYVCPTCGGCVDDCYGCIKYCYNCGRKIKWGGMKNE